MKALLSVLCVLVALPTIVGQAPAPPPWPPDMQPCQAACSCWWLVTLDMSDGGPIMVSHNEWVFGWWVHGTCAEAVPFGSAAAWDFMPFGEEAKGTGSTWGRLIYTVVHQDFCSDCPTRARFSGASKPTTRFTGIVEEGDAAYTCKWSLQELFLLLSEASNSLHVIEQEAVDGVGFSTQISTGSPPVASIGTIPGGSALNAPNNRPYNVDQAQDQKTGLMEVLTLNGDESFEVFADGWFIGIFFDWASVETHIFGSAHNTILAFVCPCTHTTWGEQGVTGGGGGSGGATGGGSGGTTGGGRKFGPTGGTISGGRITAGSGWTPPESRPSDPESHPTETQPSEK